MAHQGFGGKGGGGGGGGSSKRRELPIFSQNKVTHTPSSPITHLCANNNKVVISMQNKCLIKIDLRNPENPTEIDLKKHNVDAKLSNLFMDPSGTHLILTFSPKDSLNPAEVMYLGPKFDKPKEIVGLKAHMITAIAWNPDIESNTPSSCMPFLLGTSKGSIFEAEIVGGDVKYCKPVYDIAKGSPCVIAGLEYFPQPRSNNFVILVATSRRLYQFKGAVTHKEDRPWFTGIFTSYISQSCEEYYKEFGPPSPTGVKVFSDHAMSRLQVNYFTGAGPGYPTTVTYLADNGLMVYNSVTCNADLDILANLNQVSFPKSHQSSDIESTVPPELPRSMVTTEFHVLLLYKREVIAVCILNDEIVFEYTYPDATGRLLNIVRDQTKGCTWCFTERLIFKYTVVEEDRDIWRIFLEKGDFIKAQDYSRHDPEKLEVISMKQGDNCFRKGEYEMSAQYYAMTKASFEEVALKFVQIDNPQALKTFLMKKMSSLRTTDTAKITALVLWLIEIFLNELGTLRDFRKQSTAEYRNLDDEFRQFMAQPLVKECVLRNKKAVYELMASHGDKENLIQFTLFMKDYDEVIESNIANGQYQSALETLLKQKDASLYSRFLPILLDKDAKATIDAVITAGRMLNPLKLLPKFSSKLEPDIATQVTRYLEHCIHSLRINDQAVHDYLVSLYIHYFSSEKLMEYLNREGTNIHTVHYDPKFALLLCLEKNLKHPCIHLYTLMGLFEDAVTMAITVDLELAKTVANVPENDIDMKKKLWLKIAKHVVEEKNDIQQAMNFLHQCELLKIEDILPFFPEFVTIDHFKDAICASLHEYNQHIQGLKFEMDEATKAAELITEEIHAVRNRCALITATNSCTICENTLLVRNFYVFPCGHKFHADCLLSEIYPTLTEPRKKLLQEHQRKLHEFTRNQDMLSTGSAVISTRDQIKADIDDIVAYECIYCGDTMIKLIDTPFISEDDFNRVQREWE